VSEGAWIEWQNTSSERRRLGELNVDWRDDALCKEERIPTTMFYPDRKRGDVAAAEARKICLRCPVRLDCARWAMDAGEDHGVWGGASPRQRQRMRFMHTVDVLDVLAKPAKKARPTTRAGRAPVKARVKFLDG
jgi:WhiB family transcriptional regulator, redox-sensing transcriptional regulator